MKYFEYGIQVDDKFYSLAEITEKCNQIRIEKQEIVLLKIEWDGRGGEIYDHATYPKKIAERIKKLMLDKEISFGEIWGKHSDVYGTITEDSFKIITDKREVELFLSTHPSGSDYNHNFKHRLIEDYEDNGGREYYLEEEGEDYCNDIEELAEL